MAKMFAKVCCPVVMQWLRLMLQPAPKPILRLIILYNWLNILYGKTWRFGLFAGYLKNLGTSENIVGTVYGFATDADWMAKISPQLIYTYQNFMFGWELSLTTVAYGINENDNKGKVNTDKSLFEGKNMTATNFRNMLSIAYKF